MDANAQELHVSSNPPSPPSSQGPGPLVTLRTALVLLLAFIIGLLVAGLSYLSGTSAAGAVLAGLLSSGCSVPTLHHLIQ